MNAAPQLSTITHSTNIGKELRLSETKRLSELRKLGLTLPRLAVLRTLTRTARPASELATASGQQHGQVLRILDWLTNHGFAEEEVGWALTAIGRVAIETGAHKRLTRSQRTMLEDLRRVGGARALTDLAPGRTNTALTITSQWLHSKRCIHTVPVWRVTLGGSVFLAADQRDAGNGEDQ
jgi:DNA-binding MarR family transcriptional regulator